MTKVSKTSDDGLPTRRKTFRVKNKKSKKPKNLDSNVNFELPIAPPDDAPSMRNKWIVRPENREGVSVVSPKQIGKASCIKVTDYIIGNGVVPTLGASVKIIYEGLYPNGFIFDSNLSRKDPLIFRYGIGQVVRGLDLGIEGMRIGGAREIVIPPELGYGQKGFAGIPGGQTLIFRIRLIG